MIKICLKGKKIKKIRACKLSVVCSVDGVRSLSAIDNTIDRERGPPQHWNPKQVR